MTGTASASAAVRAGPREAGSGRALHYRALTGSQLHLHMNLEPVKLLTLLNFDPKYLSILNNYLIALLKIERKYLTWKVGFLNDSKLKSYSPLFKTA